MQSLVDAGMDGHQEKVQFIWSVAELLRGPSLTNTRFHMITEGHAG
jgi:hypothetical protein